MKKQWATLNDEERLEWKNKLTIKNEDSTLEKLRLIEKSFFYINKITKKETKRNPYPAFTTSSIQIVI